MFILDMELKMSGLVADSFTRRTISPTSFFLTAFLLSLFPSYNCHYIRISFRKTSAPIEDSHHVMKAQLLFIVNTICSLLDRGSCSNIDSLDVSPRYLRWD